VVSRVDLEVRLVLAKICCERAVVHPNHPASSIGDIANSVTVEVSTRSVHDPRGSLAGLPRYAHLDEEERLALVSRFTPACVGVSLSWAYGELTDIDAGYEAVVEPVIAHALEERSRENLLAGRQVARSTKAAG